MSDWLKLHRKSIESRIFSDPNLWRLWCWCLIKSNWKRGWYLGSELQPGQFAIGREAASEELGVSGSAWYRAMQKLQEFGCIKIEANNRFTIVSIVNWEKYQGDVNNKRTTDEQRPDNKRTTSEQQADTIEEGKESKEGKKDKNIYLKSFDEWWKLYPRKTAKGHAAKAYQAAIKKIAIDNQCDLDDAAELLLDWTSERIPTITAVELQYQKHPATWLNGECWTDEIKSRQSRVPTAADYEGYTP